MDPTARSLDDLAIDGGITAVFHAGGTALGHHWLLYAQNGSHLARTRRVHNGGKLAQAFWKSVTLTGLDANNDIHVELVGAETCALARASSSYYEKSVTVADPAGRPLVRSKRDNKTVKLYGADDAEVAELTCDGDGPWPVRGPGGDVFGEVLAGEPGPSLSAPAWQWIDPQLALNTATYARTMHLGLRRVKRYSFAPAAPIQPPALALLPLLCGLTY